MKSMKELVNYAASKYKDRIAIKYLTPNSDIQEKSFLDIKKDSQAFSSALDDLGLIGNHIAILGNSSYLWLISYLGIVNSGSVAVTIDIRLPLSDIIDEINRADVSAILYDDSYEELVYDIKNSCNSVKSFICMGDKTTPIQYSLLDILNYEIDNEYNLDVNKCCTIMFTSGTSGKSKGVMLSHEGLTENAIACAVRTGFTSENDIVISVLPIFHIFCLSVNILWSLYLGVCVCFNDSLTNLFSNIKKFNANKVAMVPMMLEFVHNNLKLVSNKNPNLTKKQVANILLGEKFDTFTIGGAYLQADLRKTIESYGVQVKEQYGMTENSCNLSTEHGCIHKDGSVGKVLSSQKFKIVDSEIFVKGNTVMLGYYKDQENTKLVIEDGWLKTGDLGYIDDEDFLFLFGRKKLLMTLSSGENVSSEQLEQQIMTSKLVKEVVVYQSGDIIVAEIYPDYNYVNYNQDENILITFEKVIENVNSQNPLYKHIRKIILREVEFEKTASMKIKRENYIFTK